MIEGELAGAASASMSAVIARQACLAAR